MKTDIVNIGPFSFNKTLFENSTAFTDVIWAVDLSSDIVYVLHDRLNPKRSGTCLTLDDAISVWYETLYDKSNTEFMKTIEHDYLCNLKKVERLAAKSWVKEEIHTVTQVKSPVFDDEGNTVQVFISFLDVQELLDSKETIDVDHDIIEALSRDYHDIYVINPEKKTLKIEKVDDYVSSGFERYRDSEYDYDEMCRKSIIQKAHPDDKDSLFEALSLKTVVNELDKRSEYSSTYRVINRKGEAVAHQFRFIALPDKRVVACFRKL